MKKNLPHDRFIIRPEVDVKNEQGIRQLASDITAWVLMHRNHVQATNKIKDLNMTGFDRYFQQQMKNLKRKFYYKMYRLQIAIDQFFRKLFRKLFRKKH